MKRRSLLAGLLALTATGLDAQSLRPGQPPGFRPGFRFLSTAPTIVEDQDAAGYLNAQTTPPSSTERALVDALVKGLKADGDWASFDWLVLMAAESAQAGRLNLKNPTKSLTAVNAPTFTPNRGYAGDGSSAYLDLGETWNAAGNQFALNFATLGAWCNLKSSYVGPRNHISNVANNPRDGITARDNAAETVQVNSTVADVLQSTPGTRAGHRSVSRTDVNTVSGFYNGIKVLASTTVSTNINSTNGSFLRSGTGYADDRLAIVYSGAGMTDAALTRIHNRFNTYLTAKGAN